MRIEDATAETGDRTSYAAARPERSRRGFETILANLRRRRRPDEDVDGRHGPMASFAPTLFATPMDDERAPTSTVLDRIEAASRLAIVDVSGPGVTASIRLRNGDRVELAVRAHPLGVEIHMVAPPALAAVLVRERSTIDARLAVRGIRLRSCRVRTSRRARTETESEPLR